MGIGSDGWKKGGETECVCVCVCVCVYKLHPLLTHGAVVIAATVLLLLLLLLLVATAVAAIAALLLLLLLQVVSVQLFSLVALTVVCIQIAQAFATSS